MKIAFGGGNLAISIDSTVGATHTTNIYMIPVAYLFIVFGVIAVLLWLGLRGRKSSK
jgi:uncharacterized membrane protein